MRIIYPRLAKLTRLSTLFWLAALIVGFGCATVTVPAKPLTQADTVYFPAAKQGDATAQLQLALAYRYGSAGAKQDWPQAWHWLNQAALGGNILAQLDVADVLLNGDLGQARDVPQALAWLEHARQLGSAAAMFRLGLLYQNGQVVTSDISRASQYYEQSARAGYRFAAWQLGRLEEAKSNWVKAYVWYRISLAKVDAERLRAQLSAGQMSQAEVLLQQWGKEGMK